MQRSPIALPIAFAVCCVLLVCADYQIWGGMFFGLAVLTGATLFFIPTPVQGHAHVVYEQEIEEARVRKIAQEVVDKEFGKT